MAILTPFLQLLCIHTLVYMEDLQFVVGQSRRPNDGCEMGVNCVLPECLCRSFEPPAMLNKTNIPQIVLFTFQGPLDDRAYTIYKKLFHNSHRNPNGCPLRFTLFLEGNNTNYSLVSDLFDTNRAEIGVSSRNHRPREYWSNISHDEFVSEVYGQKLSIYQEAGVPLEEIKGCRAPYLQTSKAFHQMLRNASHGFQYDSSFFIRKQRLGEEVVWPFTLDYGWTENCAVQPCPSSPLMGIWEFPVYSLIDLDGFDRIYHSEFIPARQRATFRYLIQNFRQFYKRNRTPFILNLRAEWLYHNQTFNATQRFITRLLSSPGRDIYFLSISDALEWIKSPRDIPDSTNFTAWKCSRVDIHPAPVAPPPSPTVKPPQQPWCLSINGVLKCDGTNKSSSVKTTSTSVPTVKMTTTTECVNITHKPQSHVTNNITFSSPSPNNSLQTMTDVPELSDDDLYSSSNTYRIHTKLSSMLFIIIRYLDFLTI